MVDVSFVIVNWKTKELVAQAIKSIEKYAEGFNWEIIVVDNNSDDGSEESLRKNFPKVKVIAKKENLGFGGGNNEGVKRASGEFILFFNSDAYLIDDSLVKLVKRAREISNLGAIAPLILNEDKTIQQSGGYFPTLIKVFWWMTFADDLPGGSLLKPYHVDHDSFYGKEREMGWLTGAAMMVPSKVLSGVGVFDEKIFMYGEDVDLCFRIAKNGYKLIMFPGARLVHIGQGSSQKLPKNAIVGEYKGLVYLYKKHMTFTSLQMVRLLLKMGALLRIFVFGLLGRKELAKIYVEAFKEV